MKVGLEIFPVTIEDEVKEFSVPRQGFLSQYFGGNAMSTRPSISPKMLARRGYDNFMYIKLVSMRAE